MQMEMLFIPFGYSVSSSDPEWPSFSRYWSRSIEISASITRHNVHNERPSLQQSLTCGVRVLTSTGSFMSSPKGITFSMMHSERPLNEAEMWHYFYIMNSLANIWWQMVRNVCLLWITCLTITKREIKSTERKLKMYLWVQCAVVPVSKWLHCCHIHRSLNHKLTDGKSLKSTKWTILVETFCFRILRILRPTAFLSTYLSPGVTRKPC